MANLRRIAVFLVGFALLVGSLLGAGTMPERTELDDRTHVDGTVVDTDPVRIETGRGILTITNAESLTDDTVSEGDVIDAYGTVEDDRTMRAIQLFHRQPWEFQYMYGISLLGGLWVLVRFFRRWVFDVAAFGFTPGSPIDSGEED